MKVEDVFKSYDLSNSLLIGYYGGGNFGDELLLEVMQNLLTENKCEDISILYRSPEKYESLHHNFGFGLVDSTDKFSIIRAMNSHKNVVVGGGGLWGLDMNLSTFLMSLLLFTARWVFRRKIFLLGVGYYDSTTRLGHIGAWLAGKAATVIIARDDETYKNFKKINKKTHRGIDIAWYMREQDNSNYKPELAKLEKRLSISPKTKTLFISLRRFQPQLESGFNQKMLTVIRANPEKNIIVALFEPKEVDHMNWQQLLALCKQYPRIQIIDFSYNPVTLYLFFKKYHKHLVFIGPQFHAILTAHLGGVPFLPVSYDNKVGQLLNKISQTAHFNIESLQEKYIQELINLEFKKT